MVFWSRSRFFFLKNESEIIYRISVIIVNSDKEDISAYGEHPLFLSYRLSIIAFNINHCKETFWITFAPLLSGLWLQRDSELTILHFLSESGRSLFSKKYSVGSLDVPLGRHTWLSSARSWCDWILQSKSIWKSFLVIKITFRDRWWFYHLKFYIFCIDVTDSRPRIKHKSENRRQIWFPIYEDVLISRKLLIPSWSRIFETQWTIKKSTPDLRS